VINHLNHASAFFIELVLELVFLAGRINHSICGMQNGEGVQITWFVREAQF